MSVFTSAGSRFFIRPAGTSPNPQVAEVTSIGTFGRVYDEVKYSALDNRNVLKFKGQRDDGMITLQLGRFVSDTGQSVMLDALDDDADYSVTIILNDADPPDTTVDTKFAFLAKVLSYQTTIGAQNQVVAATATLSIKTDSITETPAS